MGARKNRRREIDELIGEGASSLGEAASIFEELQAQLAEVAHSIMDEDDDDADGEYLDEDDYDEDDDE